MEMPPWLQAVVAVVVFLVGGGTLGPWLARRVRSGQVAEQTREMEKTFASRNELNGLRESLELKVEAVHGTAKSANAASQLAVSNAEQALQTAQRIDTESRLRWEGIAKEMADTARTLERVTDRLQRVSDQVIRLDAQHNPEGNHA